MNARRAVANMTAPHVLAAGMAALFAACLVYRASSCGLRFTPDSRAYLDAAHSLASNFGLWLHDGCGKTRWMTHFPPLFPALLALGLQAGAEGLAFARFMNILCAAVSAGSLAWFTARCSGKAVAGFCAGAALATLPAFLTVHSWFLSEPLFLSIFVLAMIALSLAVEQESGRLVALAGTLFGLAAASRFAALAFLPAVVAYLWFAARNRRLILWFICASSIPTLFVAALNTYYTGNWSDRGISVHPIDRDYWLQGLNNFSEWFGMDGFGLRLKVLLFIAGITVAGILAVNRRLRTPGFLLSITLAASYFLLLAGARLLSDEGDIELEARHLLPLFCLLVISVATFKARWPALLCLVFLALVHWRSVVAAPVLRPARDNSNHPAWKESETLRYASQVAQQGCLYSTSPDVVYLYSGKQSFWTPHTEDKNWCGALHQDLVRRRPAAFILLDGADYARHQLIPAPQLRACLSTAREVTLQDGSVLFVP